MARPRAHSGAEGPKEPHSVSLKGMLRTTTFWPNLTRWRYSSAVSTIDCAVVESPSNLHSLSRPSLAHQYPLPAANTKISRKAGLSFPSDNVDNQFILTPHVRPLDPHALLC
jgi:hypothetical protein